MPVPILRSQAKQDTSQPEAKEMPRPAYGGNNIAAFTPAGVLKRLSDIASELSGPRPAY
jgi:hypothetical protein